MVERRRSSHAFYARWGGIDFDTVGSREGILTIPPSFRNYRSSTGFLSQRDRKRSDFDKPLSLTTRSARAVTSQGVLDN